MTTRAMALFLEALATVESANDPRAVGRSGELGRWQLAPVVVEASCGRYGAREVEREIVRIEQRLTLIGVDPQPFNIYLAYNAGIGAVERGAVQVVTYQRAERFCNVLEQLRREAGE